MATTHFPNASFYPTSPSNKPPVWNSTPWLSFQTIVAFVTNDTMEPPVASANPYKYASIIIFTIVFILGSVGNFLVIWILGFKMKRTVVTLFFLHLSLADFVYVLQLPFSILHVAMDGYWVMGTAMCKLLSFGLFVNMNASVYFLMLISVDRYVALLHPVASLPLRHLSRARWLCLAVWVVALLLSLPSLVVRTTIEDDGFIFCYNHYGDSLDEQTKNILPVNSCRFVLGFAVPYLVMICCYCRIGAKVRHIDKARRGSSLKIIAAVVLAFFVCWAPYHAIVLMEAASYPVDDVELFHMAERAYPVVGGIVSINSCINPILYVLSGSDLKARFKLSLITAIENVFRDKEQLDSGQDSGSSRTQPLGVTNLSNHVSSHTSGNFDGSHNDAAPVAMVQEEQV